MAVRLRLHHLSLITTVNCCLISKALQYFILQGEEEIQVLILYQLFFVITVFSNLSGVVIIMSSTPISYHEPNFAYLITKMLFSLVYNILVKKRAIRITEFFD
jgi:hypothetical protein